MTCSYICAVCVKIIRKKDQQTVPWTGGTTTQLFIFPEGADYKARDFLFRISTAVIETETSTFTNLPGVSRIIMVLDGTLELTHEGHYTKTLKPFEMDAFKGDWNTSSIGKVRDFNLMMAGKVTGNMAAHILEAGETLEQKSSDSCDVLAYYVFKGEAAVSCADSLHILREHDLVLFSDGSAHEQIKISSVTTTEVVIIQVMLNRQA